MVADRLLSSATHSNDDIDWPVHSLVLSFLDLRGLPWRRLLSTVPCSMIFGSVSWRQTWPNHNSLRRLMVDSELLTSGNYIDLLPYVFVCFRLSFMLLSKLIMAPNTSLHSLLLTIDYHWERWLHQRAQANSAFHPLWSTDRIPLALTGVMLGTSLLFGDTFSCDPIRHLSSHICETRVGKDAQKNLYQFSLFCFVFLCILDHKDVILVVYSIDGLPLQSRKTQAVLSSLARIGNIHVIATTNHVNVSLCESRWCISCNFKNANQDRRRAVARWANCSISPYLCGQQTAYASCTQGFTGHCFPIGIWFSSCSYMFLLVPWFWQWQKWEVLGEGSVAPILRNKPVAK